MKPKGSGASDDLFVLKHTESWDWPEDAASLLIKVLSDASRDESERLEAAYLAGESTVACDDIAEVLLSVAMNDSEPERLRERAAISLGPALEEADEGLLDDDDEPVLSEETYGKIQSQFCALLGNPAVPGAVRRAALEASVRSPQEWHDDAVREAYASADPSWHLTAVFCMQYIRDFDELILKSLDSADERVVHFAILAAGNWELDAAWDKVEAILQSDVDKPLRLAAIEAAGSIRPAQALPMLYELSNSDDADIKSVAQEALAFVHPELRGGGEFSEDE